MRNLRKRLERLETRLTDGSGCVPYSAEWFIYWTRQAERLLAGENVPKPPIAFFDAVLADWRKPTKLCTNDTPAQGDALRQEGECL